MEAFEFFIPQNIMVGAGTMAKLPECAKKLGGSHAMLISGPTLRKMGIVDKAADYLKEAGMKVDIFTDVEANPSVTTVEKATEAFKEAGADFVKTSTGFSTGGAKVEDIRLMRETVGPDMGVKASGGVRDFEKAQAMIEAGATRIGTSSAAGIVE